MISEYCAIFGAVVKPPMAQLHAYDAGMKPNYRKILAQNVAALMKSTPALSSHAKLAAHCSTPVRKIGARTIGHLLNFDNGPQPQLDTIIAVADAFRIEPWLLLRPDFDAASKTVRALVLPAMTEVTRRIIDLSEERRDLLFEIFARELDDDDEDKRFVEETHRSAMHAPRGAQYRIQRSPKKT